MTDQSLMDKSLRSVFVGNIPYEATEEKLKDIFSEVGPVLSFKLVYDRETGKPKGYGFCEYKDQETALSAMRNLNGYEIGGRTLRVDNACTEKSRMEMQSLLQGPVVENPYGEAVQADKAPEAISKAVASLPPEQMFELMKQMKLCVQNNPSEARAMLLQNPQLAYALLQAQVVMRIVDPHTAVNMLHKSNPVPVPLMPSDKAPTPVQAPVQQPTPVPPPAQVVAVTREEAWPGPSPVPVPIPAPIQNPTPPFGTPDVDLRPIDPRLARMGDQDLRVLPGPPVTTAAAPVRDPRENFIPEHFRDHRAGDLRAVDSRAGEHRSADPRPGVDPRAIDPRAVDPRAVDPRAVDPRAVDPRAVDPRAVDPRAVDPRAVDPRAVDPRAVDPRAVDPRAVDPRAVDPRAVDPRAVDPRAVDPRAVDPRAVDPRAVDPRAVDPRAVDPRAVDPRAVDPRAVDPRAIDPRAVDPRAADPRAVDPRAVDPRAVDPRAVDPRAVDPRAADPRAERFPQRDPRERVDPRTGVAPVPGVGPRPPQPGVPTAVGPRPSGGVTMSPISTGGGGASDQEKAALIMQVLQLSDEQIAMLPPEQRQSILVLKEQIAKSTQR